MPRVHRRMRRLVVEGVGGEGLGGVGGGCLRSADAKRTAVCDGRGGGGGAAERGEGEE